MRYYLIYKNKIIAVDKPFNDAPIILVYEPEMPIAVWAKVPKGTIEVAIQQAKDWIDREG